MIRKYFFSKIAGLLVLFSLLLLESCERNNLEREIINCNRQLSFEESIEPLFRSKCANSGCHDGSGTIGDYTKYEEIKIRVDNGRLRLFVLNLRNMPPDQELSQEDSKKIECWIDQGAKN